MKVIFIQGLEDAALKYYAFSALQFAERERKLWQKESILNNLENTLRPIPYWHLCRLVRVLRCRTGARTFRKTHSAVRVVRIADELEPEAVDRVKIMSLEYAMKVFSDLEDSKEFVRCVKVIVSPDAVTRLSSGPIPLRAV